MRGLLKNRVTIKRYTTTRTGISVVNTWVIQIQSVPCSVQRLRGDELLKYDREVAAKMYKVFCEANDRNGDQLDIQEKDKCFWGSREFDIKSVFNVFDHHLRIEMEEVL